VFDTIHWDDFLKRLRAEGFTIVTERKFTAEGEQRTSLVAADPKRFLLLHASSVRYGSPEKVHKVKVSGFVDASRNRPAAAKLLTRGFSHGSLSSSPTPFTLSFVKINDFDRLSRSEFVALLAYWSAVAPLEISERPASDVEWREFCRSAPGWVKAFLGEQ